MPKPKSVLVTGCAGFIGSSFTKQFRDKYPRTAVVGIDDLTTGRIESVNPSALFYEGSMLDRTLLNKVFKRHSPEYVFHFAALPRVSYSIENPVRSSEVNIIGTVSVLEAAKTHGIKRFIYSSSSSVYGGAKKLPTKEVDNLPDPKSPYAIQKYIGEPFCRSFSTLFGLDTICLRYFNVFGPGQYGDSAYATVISAWLEALYFPDKKRAFIEGDGNQTRDFCFVDNAVSANILAMESKKQFMGDVFNVAHGEQYKLNYVKTLIEQLARRSLQLEKRPPRLGDFRHSKADISKAQKLLNYRPEISFEQGLEQTVKWFESRRK